MNPSRQKRGFAVIWKLLAGMAIAVSILTPAHASTAPAEIKAARGFVFGGAAPAFKMSARAKAEVEGEEQTRDEIRRALIEARYTHGLRHINTDDNGDEDRIKNRDLRAPRRRRDRLRRMLFGFPDEV